jgi:RNA-splicing ligase RtcB
MIELQGKYNKAKVFTDNIENKAISQIIDLCNQEFVKDSKIRIMPDTHAGAGCTIGTTMTIKDKVVANLVGVDIGCGMLCCKLKENKINLEKLDNIIHTYIPNGFNVRETTHEFIKYVNINNLKCKTFINMNRAELSLGTLGGGNHFIEVNKDSNENIYLVIHTGSRYLGKQVAEHYQNIAIRKLSNDDKRDEIIKELRLQGKEKEIQQALENFKPINIKKELAYLQNEDFKDYIHDMKIVQEYAKYNRHAIVNEILKLMNLDMIEEFTTIHNYIDTDNMILRKGAISAQENEKVIIPLNMKDGSILAIGKGNEDWNYSAPHGAGRLFSRSSAKSLITLKEFTESMEGIYSTSVNRSTIDESPMAYKPMGEILENIKDSVDIVEIIKPIYNFKASN